MKSERNMQIEGLRGIAMLMIVLYHLFFRYPELFCKIAVNELVETILPGIAVPTFMILSALFLDNYKTNPTMGKISNFIRMVFLKLKRLWPAYAISILLITAIRLALPLEGRGTIDLKVIITNLLFVNGYIGIDYIDSAHWYLTSLISATIIIAFIVNLWNTRKKNILLLLWLSSGIIVFFTKNILSGTIGGRIMSALYVAMGSNYIPIFVFGILINKLFNRKEKDSFNIVLIISSIAYILCTQSIIQVFEASAAICLVILVVAKKIPML